MKRWRQKGQYQYSAMLSVAAGSLGSICILFLTGAARAAHAHPCLSSAAPFHGAFEFTDRHRRSTAPELIGCRGSR